MDIVKKCRGRHSKNPDAEAFLNKDFYRILVEKLPPVYVRDPEPGFPNQIDTLALSKAMGVSRWTVYRFLNEEKLSKITATGLMRVSREGGSLTESDLLPFLLRF